MRSVICNTVLKSIAWCIRLVFGLMLVVVFPLLLLVNVAYQTMDVNIHNDCAQVFKDAYKESIDIVYFGFTGELR